MKNIFSVLLSFVTVVAVFSFSSPATAANSARFYLSPSTGTFKAGDTITTDLMVDTAGQPINAAEGSISYSSDLLTFQSIATTGSIFTFWTNGPTGSSTIVNFGGGLSNPGYAGSSGKVLSIIWKAKANGVALVSVVGTKILANDGAGTNIYGSSSSGTFTIGAATVSEKPEAKSKASPAASVSIKSSSHSDQNKWYNLKDIVLSWSGANGVTGYVLSFDQSATAKLPDSPVSTETSKNYPNTVDGIWYFHVKGKTANGFTSVTDYKFQIDTVPPEEFTVSINQDGGSTNPNPKVSFEARDSTSGIGRYEAQVDGGPAFAIKNGDTLPKQKPGNHAISIKAIDKAGNVREGKATYQVEGISQPLIVDWTKLTSLLHPISFIGRSQADDTVNVYLGDKLIESFKAKDKQVSFDKLSLASHAEAGSSDEIAWEYIYKDLILPGDQYFSFSRVNIQGSESAQTVPLKVHVEVSAIAIGRFVLPTNAVIIALLVLIVLLLTLVIYLFYKIRHFARSNPAVGVAIAQIKKIFAGVEKDVAHEVESTIPAVSLSKEGMKALKADLKQKLKGKIEDDEKKLG